MKMSVQRMCRDFNLSRRIPLHYQKRYLSNISNGSFNATFVSGIYKKKINELLKINKALAIGLQSCKGKMQELMEESKCNANAITFSRLKLSILSGEIKKTATVLSETSLAGLSCDLKKVGSVLDETLSLLQMHSTISSSKFTPTHTMGRNEFKDQVREIIIESIPEEPDSPQETPNETNNGLADSSKNCVPLSEKMHPESHIHITDISDQPSKKQRKVSNVLKPSKMNGKRIGEDMKTSKKNCQSILTDNSYEESTPAKIAATKSKMLSNKNKILKSEDCYKKKPIKTTVNKKSRKVAKNTSCKDSKIVCFHEGIDLEKIKPLENNSNAKTVSRNGKETSLLKSDVSPYVLSDKHVIKDPLVSDIEKENKRPKMSVKRVKSLSEVQLEGAVFERNDGRKSTLKNLSSEFNIKNSKNKGKFNLIQIDDLITTKQKSMPFVLNNESCNTSKSYCQDFTRQEMVKNLAENTFLVTAEVHQSPEPLEADKIKLQKDKSSIIKQPVVVLKDIFESGKSFCKSISSQDSDELNEFPLQMKLLQHCSSLKVIPEESSSFQDNSIAQPEKKARKPKSKNIEPPLSFEDQVLQQPLGEDKKMSRRRTTVNYKELPLNVKQRR